MKGPMNEIIELSIAVKATPNEIWRALTDTDELENWWGDDVVLQPQKGGKFSEPWEDDKRNKNLASGTVLAVKDKKEITFTWKEQTWAKEANTKCTISIEDKGMVRMIKIKHEGWETLPEKEQAQTIKDFKTGWGYHLKELKAYLDE